MDVTYSFGLHDQLPTTYDVVSRIISVAPGGSPNENRETALRKKVLHSFATQLVQLWQKSFTEIHVLTLNATKKRIRKELSEYYRKVQTCKANKRLSRKNWRIASLVLFDLKKKTSDPNYFEKTEKMFYIDQQRDRNMYLSEEIDEEFEESRKKIMEEKVSEQSLLEDEISFIYDGQDDITPIHNSSVILSQSANRSDLVRMSLKTEDKSIQTDSYQVDRPKIRKQRNCTDDVKTTCAQVSASCGISAEKARIAVETVCKHLYHHDFYLSVKEIPVDSRKQTSAKDNEEPEPKRLCIEMKKPPVNTEQLIQYKNVLPSVKTIVEYKQLQAAQEETDTALAIINKSPGVKITLHYDTTSCNNIDGEWPSLIMNFSDGQRFRLRPIFVAHEDRDNIVRLIIVTYDRLALAATIMSTKSVSSLYLWKMTNSIMTDAVSKNLLIEDGVAEKLGIDYKPYHLLCKSHTVEN